MASLTQEDLEMRIVGHITMSIDDARLIRTRNIHQDYFVYVAKGDRSSITRYLFKRAMQYFNEHGRLLSCDALEMMMKQDMEKQGMPGSMDKHEMKKTMMKDHWKK